MVPMSPQAWRLSRALLMAILEDRFSDRFVATLVWERLGYAPSMNEEGLWRAGPGTPAEASTRRSSAL